MNPKKFKRKKEQEKKQALIKIKECFKQANLVFKKDKTKANNYIRKLRRLAMKHRIILPKSIKRRICKHCYKLLLPGTNLRVRTKPKHKQVIYYCLECKHFMKFGYSKKN